MTNVTSITNPINRARAPIGATGCQADATAILAQPAGGAPLAQQDNAPASALSSRTPRRRSSRRPLDPEIQSRLYTDRGVTRLGVTAVFGGRLFAGSVPVTAQGHAAGDAVAGLLERLAASIRRQKMPTPTPATEQRASDPSQNRAAAQAQEQ
jgi:hypothetical protein